MVTPLEGRPSRELSSVEGLFDPDGYRSTFSDIAALLVFSHQTHMTNLLTRAGWEARAADPTLHPAYVAEPGENDRIAEMMRGIANEVVDYLLFIDEAPLPERIHGSSGFAERFSTTGPRDSQGRSLHELDLEPPAHEISLQLPDLLGGIRRAAAGGEGADLPAHVADPVRTGARARATSRPCRATIARPSSRSCATPRKICRSIFSASLNNLTR